MKTRKQKQVRSVARRISRSQRRIGRKSAYIFATCLGIWLPKAYAAVLVDLDATALPEGALATWKNNGTLPGDFTSAGDVVPQVTTVQGVKGISFLGGTSGTAGTHYVGPVAPAEIVRGSPRTIEAWVYNPSPQGEEVVAAWGRRGGTPDGSNWSFNHATDPNFGAGGIWGAQDIGWNGYTAFGRWTYIVMTYDGANVAVYADGLPANTEASVLDTWEIDNTAAANPLPIRIARQNNGDGTPSPTGVGEITIAKVRIHDEALDAAAVKAKFDQEKTQFWVDSDHDGMPDWFEVRYGLDPNTNDASADTDGDGLTNLEEYESGETIGLAFPMKTPGALWGIDPKNADVDGDGAKDGAEVKRTAAGTAAPTNPFNSDTDGDGLPDGVETGTGTFASASNTGSDPLKSDSDGDSFGDFQEVVSGSDPNNASSTPGASRPALVSLISTNLPTGALNAWTNNGTIGGLFVAPTNGIPNVQSYYGVKAAVFDGGNDYLTGPAAPAFITGNASRTVEAWIYNPVAADEETIFSWGRRGGPDGSNNSFNHGLNGDFGAVGHWGAPDVGWGDPSNVRQSQWTYVVYTYDGETATSRVYSNGTEANEETAGAPLNTWAVDTAGRPLPFRVASQTDDNGNATAGLRGSMAIAELRVYDRVLDPTVIQANFDASKDAYGLVDYDSDGLPTYYERQYSFLNERDASDATKDQDGDGLSNLAEYQARTAPDNPDTDGDGVADGAEVNRTAGATNPLNPDSDGDGLSDKVESGTGKFVDAQDTGTDPLSTDTDFDGFADGLEVSNGSNPLDASSLPPPKTLINLDASNLALGDLLTWPNTGTITGNFVAPTNGPGTVELVGGIKGVTLDGVNDYYIGPVPNAFVTGNGSRTVEAWIYNPVAADEETIFAWGRRGGPDGSNNSFNHGVNPNFGAVGHWGGPDIGWGDPSNIKQGEWTYVVYTWDGPTLTTRVYADGVEASEETLAAPLNTWTVDTSNRPLHFVVGSQVDDNGSPTIGLRGSMTIARIRVSDQALSADAIAAKYNEELPSFIASTLPQLQVARNAGSITITWSVESGKTYSVEATPTLSNPNWTSVTNGLTQGQFSEQITSTTPSKFYRVRVE